MTSSAHSRKLDGVLLVRKPSGCTSSDVVRVIKRRAGGGKVGHTGTLDPMAVGLLPLTLGEATKLSRWLSGGDKRYRAMLLLGAATDTLDRDGKIVEQRPVPELRPDALREVLAGLVGEIRQVPPMYSAVRHNGRRLHRLARAGIEVERSARPVRIHSLDLLAVAPDRIEFDVRCSAGTYVRVLAVEIASALGTVGHLIELERTETAGWSLAEAHELSELTPESLRSAIRPLEDVLHRFQGVLVSESVLLRLVQGQRLDSETLAQLGVVLPTGESRVVYFQAGPGRPFVLAELNPAADPVPLRILRVLHPPAAAQKNIDSPG